MQNIILKMLFMYDHYLRKYDKMSAYYHIVPTYSYLFFNNKYFIYLFYI